MSRLTLLIAAALVAAACVSGGSAPVSSVRPSPITTAQPVPTTVATVATTSQPPPGLDELSPEIAGQIEELIATTEQIRQLDFVEPPTVEVVSREELATRVTDELAEDTENVDTDQALYQLLGLLDPETDLLALYTEVFGEQVAGFYDGDTRQLVIPAGSDRLNALEQGTLVHELTHAVTDQTFSMWDTFNDLIDTQRFDEASALQAVIEGDAVFTELQYVRGLPRDQQEEWIEASLGVETSAIDAAPQYLQESIIFPYVQGQIFVERLHQLGGYPEIDAAYQQWPVSTEQVITPRDYRRDQPVPIEAPAVVIDGYEQVYDSVWGELGFQLMFSQILDGRPAASDGWGGDRFLTFFDGTEVAMVLEYRGDTTTDADELAAALLEYVPAAMAVGEATEEGAGTVFAGDDYAFVARSGETVVWVAASDPAVGESITAGFAEP